MTTNRTIFVYTTLYTATGGGQSAMTVLAQHLHKRGYESVFFTRPPFQPDHRYVRALSEIGVPIYVFKRYGDTWWGKLLLAVLAPLLFIPYMLLRRCGPRRAWVAVRSVVQTWLVRREELHATETLTRCLRAVQARGREVVLHIWSPAGLSPVLLRWANQESVPAVFHEMGEADEPYFRTWDLGPSVAEMHRAAAVICSCPTVADNIRKVYGYKGEITTIPFPIADPGDAFDRGQKTGGRFMIGVIGRLVAHKRHGDLLAAVRSLADLCHDVGLVIAGDGPMRQPLAEEAARLGIADRIHFTGEFERLEEVMARFDVFAITSTSESQCMPILESGAYAKPVVVAAFGGMPDFVEDGVTGMLVPLGYHDALVAALKKLIDDPALRQAMGEAGRKWYLARYTAERVADAYEAVYDRLLADRPAAGLSVAYVVECFATFIVNEVQWLRRLGARVTLLGAFRLPQEIDPIKEAYKAESLYFPPRYRGVLWSNVICLLRHPAAYLHAIRLIRRKGESLRMLPLAAYFARTIRAAGVQHLHGTFGTRTTTLAFLVSRLSGRGYSFTTHAYDIYRPNPSLVWKTNESRFMRTISAFNKRYILDTYHGTDQDKVRVVYLGVDSQSFAPRPPRALDPDHVRVVAVGSLIEQKGHVVLIRACRRLIDGGRRVFCRIIGEGDKRNVIEKEITRLGMEEHVSLTGELPYEAIQQNLNEADVFALPCIDLRGHGEHVDGIPVAIMEAMALGLPVVSTDLSGIPELIETGMSGLLVPEKDEQALADALARLIDDEALRANLGRGARKQIEEKFDLRRNVQKLARLFEEADKVMVAK